MIYLDTSALAKKYISEAGSDSINKIINDTPDTPATSKITIPEMLSALNRRSRAGDIPGNKLAELEKAFGDDWNCFYIIDFHDELLPIVKRVIKKHFLKAADAVHLSSALWLRKAVKENITFVASDNALLEAAESEMLEALNPVS